MPLLVLGFALGVGIYVALGVACVRGARGLLRGGVAFYWRNRSRRESAEVVRRVQRVAAPPVRRAA
jgi:hypothetical protein